MEEIVGELTFQARRSPDVNQASGVSVRMSIANYETLVASAVRRALRRGEREAVPRISDLEALDASTCGKLELEYAGVERSEADVIRELVQRATKCVFDERVPLEALAAVVGLLRAGLEGRGVGRHAARTSTWRGSTRSRACARRRCGSRGGDSPARLASAIEFVLEGLHLSNRLNKQRARAARSTPAVKAILVQPLGRQRRTSSALDAERGARRALRAA